MQRHAWLGAALAAAATVALIAVVSLSAQQQGAGAVALASLRNAGTWPAAPGYEPQVGDVLSARKVRDFHPRRPGGRGRATSAGGAEAASEPPLVTAHTEREVSAGAACARDGRGADMLPPRAMQCMLLRCRGWRGPSCMRGGAAGDAHAATAGAEGAKGHSARQGAAGGTARQDAAAALHGELRGYVVCGECA